MAALVGAASLAIALAAALPPAAPTASAQRLEASPAPRTAASAEASAATLESPALSLPVDGLLSLGVRSRLDTGTAYYEARFQVLRPSGGVMLQKTEIRHDLPAGETVVRFERELASLGLRPAAYPVRVRVRLGDASGRRAEHLLEDTLYLFDPDRAPVPVALVVRLTGAPSLDPEGRFVSDPALYTEERDAALGLARETAAIPARFSVAVPPLLLHQWRRAADGYRTVGPEGISEIGADTDVPRSYREALDELARLVSSERVEMLDVPYAEPDLAGLEAAGAMADLERHFAYGSSEYVAALEETPSAGTLLDGAVPPSALSRLARRGIGYAVVQPSALMGGDAKRGSGAYPFGESTTTALVLDEEAGARLAESPAKALSGLFERYLAEEAPRPAVVVMELGPGRRTEAEGVAAALSALRDAGWIRTVTAAEAAAAAGERSVRLAEDAGVPASPPGYWADVGAARRWAEALAYAAGEEDPDAEASRYAVLLAESGAWAGADGSWSLADRGRAYGGAAERTVRSVLGALTVQAQDIRLSGRDGAVPVNLSNGAERPLRVIVRLRSSALGFPGGSRRVVELRPGDNYLTFPVEIYSALKGEMRVSVHAGETLVSQTDVTVSASYIDRVAIVSAVVLVLIGMLVFIKRRVDRADSVIIDG